MRRSPGSALALGLALVVVTGAGACGGSRPAGPAARECPADRTLVIAGQDDVARYASCRTASGVAIRTGAPLDLAPMRGLEEITGDLSIGPSVGLEGVAFPELTTVGGAVVVSANNNLKGVFLPRLASVGRVSVDGNVALTTLSLPQLPAVTASLVITRNADLELVDVGALTAVGKDFVLADNPSLILVEAGRLTKVGALRVDNNKALPADVVDALRARVAAP